MPWGGEVVEVPPPYCAAGHELGPNRVSVGSRPCGCSGVRDDFRAGSAHRTYFCRVPGCPDPWILRPACTDPTKAHHGHVGHLF